MKKLAVLFCMLILSANVYSQAIDIVPPGGIVSDSGPFGFGGRGVVFRAEENFSMTSFGMDLNFPGTLDFHVSVYANNGSSRGALISETPYLAMNDDSSEFFTLAHTQAFTAGTNYEIILRFSDPGVIFPHYDFNNPTLNPASGFMAGTEMLVLDGSDLDTAGINNTWLARFQLNAEAGMQSAPTPVIPVPVNSIWALLVLMLMLLVTGLYFRPGGSRRS